MRRFALIMAGGKGERLWPLSTPERPKQLIPLIDGKTLLDLALERVGDEAEKVVLTNSLIAENIRDKNVRTIVEPVPKNTAPALVYATALLQKEAGEPVLIAALPSDHHISPAGEFRTTLRRAYEAADKYGKIVTFGIIPAHPHTGYGYIERGEPVEDGLYSVVRFHEKPDYERAKEYVERGNFYWNSGMFVWRSDAFLNEVREHAPNIYNLLYDGDKLRSPEGFFSEVESISIDYAVMEKTRNILVIEATFEWIDVGSYSSLYRVLPKDGDANAYRDGTPGTVDSSENLVISGDKRVVLVGVKGVGVVIEGDTVLVVNLEEDQKVREAARKFGN